MKTLIFFLLFLFGISCQKAKKADDNHIATFELGDLSKATELKLSALGIVDIEYIPLETNEKSLIQRIRNIKVGNDYFLVQFYTIIHMFRFNGSYVTKIGTEGRGPNEFQACHDVEIDEKDQIYIVDGWKKKIFIYSENGEFLRTILFPLYGNVKYRIIDGMFLCYNQNNLGNVENSFNLINLDGEIVKSFPNKYPFIKHPNDAYGFDHENIFYRFNNKLFKKEVYSDTIYVYENMGFKPHLVIKAGDKLITPRARSEFAAQELSKKYITPRNLLEFGKYIYYEYVYSFDFANTITYGFIASKNSDFKALINPEIGIINDWDGGPNFLPYAILDDNTVIGWIDAINLKAHIASDSFKNSTPKYPERKKRLEKLVESLKDTDNPVLILVKLGN